VFGGSGLSKVEVSNLCDKNVRYHRRRQYDNTYSIRFSIDSIGFGSILSGFGSILTASVRFYQFGSILLGFGSILSVRVDSIGFWIDSIVSDRFYRFRIDSIQFSDRFYRFRIDSIRFLIDSIRFRIDSFGFGLILSGFRFDSISGFGSIL
jgi:hypothetical protein